jgi:hypothetical protein
MSFSNFLHEEPLLWNSVKFEVKVKLSLCFTKHHAMKTYRGVEV